MPQQHPDLQHVHHELMEIAKETQDVSKTKYTTKDIQHLQVTAINAVLLYIQLKVTAN